MTNKINHEKKSKFLIKTFAIVIAISMMAGSGIVLFPSGVAGAHTEQTTSDSDHAPTINQEPIPPFTLPTIPPFERIEEPYNITLVTMNSPTGPLYEGKRKPVQVILKNKADHNIHDIHLDVYDQLDDGELAFLTYLFYGSIPKGKEQTKTFTWEPEAGTHYLRLEVNYTDNGVEQLNEEEFGFYVMREIQANKNGYPQGSPDSYPGDPTLPWVIEDETIIQNNIITLDDGVSSSIPIDHHENNIVVTSGATTTGHLTIIDTFLPIWCDPDGEFSITIDSGCTLEIIGNSKITGTQPDLTFGFVVHGTLNVQGTSDTVRSKIHWIYGDISNAENPGGIQLHPGSDATLDYAEIWQGRSHNIYADSATLTLTNTKVLGAQTDFIGCGIYAIGDSVVNVQGCNVSGSGHSGIYSTSVNTHIDGLEAWNNHRIGVYLKNTGSLNPFKKSYYAPGYDLGYYIWVDDEPFPETWHIRWSGDGAGGPSIGQTFQGSIYTSVPIINIEAYDFEIPSDTYDFTFPDSISFQAEETVFEDGLDFTLEGPGEVTFLALSIDDQQSDRIFVGAGGGSPVVPTPPQIPWFTLKYQPTISDSIIMKSGTKREIPSGSFGVALDNSAPYVHDVGPVYSGAHGLYSDLSSPIIEDCNFSYNGNGVIFERGSPAVLDNMFYKNSNAGGCGWEPQIGVVACGGIIKDNMIIGNHGETKAPPPGPGTEDIQTGIVALNSTTRIESNTIKEQVKNGMFLENYSGVVISNDLRVGREGIQVSGGENILLDSNTISGFGSGIGTTGTSNSRICGNTIDSCGGGIDIGTSTDIDISDNTISLNERGIQMTGSDNILVYHNNIFFNTIQAYDDGTNFWDNGYPSGGNYWSDYAGEDLFSGPGQDIPGSDGIGDTPYTDIQGGAGNLDYYPLMEPWNLLKSAPFRINSDAELISEATSRGWAGDGSKDYPYVIERYNIDGTGQTNCIYIGNTSLYFVVRNCYLHHASENLNMPYYYNAGLYLCNVQYGTITNNIVSSNVLFGIYTEGSSNIDIHRNKVTSHSDGIRVDLGSSYNSITENIISDNSWGIVVQGWSCYNTVSGNEVTKSSNIGIYVAEWSSGTTIETNTVHTDTGYGISASDGHDYIVNYNFVYSCQEGIHLNYSDSSEVTNNQVYDCSDVGIYFHHSNNNLFAGNTISDNTLGMYSTLLSTDNLIYRNNFIDNAIQAYDDSSNFWDADLPIGGNYWSDWESNVGYPDEYKIPGDGNIDHHPFAEQNGWL